MAGEDFLQTTFAVLIQDGVLEIGDGYRAKNEELGGQGPLFLRAGHVTDTHIEFEGVERFHVHLAERLVAKMSRPGDTIITTKGNSTGRTSYVTDSMPPFVYSPHLSYWRSKTPDSLANGFLRYWARSEEFTRQLAAMKASTDMAPYLSLTDQRRLHITLPPIHEQQAIACVLGALDDKIELNRRRSRTLEAMARAIFQSWFVDFDPVRAKAEGRKPTGLSKELAAIFPDSFEESELGEIPKGWHVGTVGDVAEFNGWTLGKRDALDGIDYIEISEVTRGDIAKIIRYVRGEEPGRARRRLRHGDTAISTVRPDRGSYFLCIDPPPSLIASTGFAVLTAKGGHWAFVHVLTTRNDFGQELGRLADGGAYPAVRPEVIAARSVVIPSNDGVFSAFEKLVQPLFLKSEAARKESRALAALQDTLLPNLISGELRVPDAERIVGRAT